MKKRIYILTITILLLIVQTGQAQKIKVKKGIISLDKKEIAKVTSPYRDHYVFTSLAGKELLYADLTGKDNGTEEIYHFLKVQTPDGTKKAQVEYEVLITSLKVERIITHLLTIKYKLFNANGLNEVALKTFFKNNNKDLEEKYTSIVVKSKLEAKEKKQREIQIRNQYYPQVQANKSITFTQRGKMRIVGRIGLGSAGYNGKEATIYVYDLDGIKVATLNTANRELASKKYIVTTWDNNQFTYTANRYYSKNNNAFLQELIIELVYKGYLLEHQAKIKKNKHYNAKLNLAKERSVNLIGVPGYLIDEKGERYQGHISILFEKWDIEQTGQKLPEYGPDNYGQIAQVRYANEKGKIRYKTFNAKDNNYFCLNTVKSECFYGLKTQGEAFKKIQNLNALKFNNAYYYKLLKKEKNSMLLQDPVEKQKYVIKVSTQKKGFMIDNRSNEKLAEKLATYLSGCTSLSNEIKQDAFSVKIEENLYQIIEEYKNCKK
ncbi:hypothetical protein [Polaribacter sp. L3A8]|uniref:hypothetical protein n=1 Tax=Polaribacter sp. L3A8 TaxID=2686361 RepID=UPI00131D9C56|nr:hypothetical protein [Polaribacter sp. L3A8]